MTGVLCAAAIVSIFGMSHVRWSFLMVVMAGSALFWMENLQRCIQAEVRREDRTHLVRVRRTLIQITRTLGVTRTVHFFCGRR